MIKSIQNVFKNFANFNGRARRSDFWYFLLFNFLVCIVVLAIVMASADSNGNASAFPMILLLLYTLITIIPYLALMCRRMHDIGKPGSYVLFYFLPVVGTLIILIWFLEDGQPWDNRYGPDPKGRNMANNLGMQSPYPPSPVQAPPQRAPQPIQPAPQKRNPAAQAVRPEPQPINNQVTVPLNPQPVRGPSPVKICCLCELGSLSGTKVSGTRIVIGRDVSACNMVFPAGSPGISKKHCELRTDSNGGVIITDLGSSYGTYLSNGQKLSPNQPARINLGDHFYLASKQTVIRVMKG